MTDLPKEYAKALYELAKESKLEDTILDQMVMVTELLNQNPEYMKLLDSPMISTQDRMILVNEAFGSILNVYLLNFIKILVEKRQFRQFINCQREFLKFYDEAHNRERITVITAVPLTENQKDRLIKALEEFTNKTILPTYQVDPGCLGGVIVRFRNSQIDGSVKGKLNQIRNQILSAVV